VADLTDDPTLKEPSVPESTPPPLTDWLAAHAASHQRLAGIVGQLSADEVAGPSYDSDWSVAQVLSHLGSGAQIFTLFLRAGVEGASAPGMPEFQPVWDRWNAKTPADQAADALVAERAFLDQLDALDDQRRQDWHLDMFGGTQSLSDLLRLRVGEHAVHTWDVAVIGQPTATVAPDAVELLIDTLGQLASRTGRAPGQALQQSVATHSPARGFMVVSDNDAVELRAEAVATPPTDQTGLRLPAEAFLRLVYGRLDAAHTPNFEGDENDLDLLRRTFPGF
jgi:uncharacterized protein (TIGR03083 family)